MICAFAWGGYILFEQYKHLKESAACHSGG
jgi:hypothetical protein